MTITPAVYLPLVGLSDEHHQLLTKLLNNLSFFQHRNTEKLAYYEGTQRVRQLGITIPPSLRDIEVVVGWPGTTVDVVEERLDWYGWASEGDDLGLDEVYADNALDVDSGKAHLDALIYGTSFVVVGRGGEGEPPVLVTPHSPRTMTGLWDHRSRRLTAALALWFDDDGLMVGASLYTPDETIVLSHDAGRWGVEQRDLHRLGRVPVVQLENRARTDIVGRSEITRTVRSLTDQAVRTMLGMEIHREFYQAPQRWIMGVDESQFVDADGNKKTGWETVMGRVLALPRDDEGEVPQVGQFTAAAPTPYLEQARGLGQMLATEVGIPPSYLGFQTDNPASADAILRSEARLVKRSERRQSSFGKSWLEVARLALLARDRAVPDSFRDVSARWREPATPTRSAAADEAVKLVQAGVLPPDSRITYDRIGLSPAEQRLLDAEKRRAAGRGVLETLQRAAGRQPSPAGQMPEGAPGAEPDNSA